MTRRTVSIACGLLAALLPGFAASPDLSQPPTASPFPDATASALRLIGAMVFVVGLFLAAAWGFRRWQQVSRMQNGGPRLVVLDVQSLGARQALYVVAYDRQRMLVGVTPGGVSLVSHLPDAESAPQAATAPVSFAAALQQVVQRKAS